MSLMAATALGSLAFALPTTVQATAMPAATSTSIIAKTGIFDPTLKVSTVLQTKSFYDTQQFGAAKSILANNTYIPAAKHFMVATDTTQGPADNTGGKKAKVTDAGWAALLHASAGFKASTVQSLGMRDQLKRVAFIDKADQPAPVTFYTAASRGYFAA